MIIPNLIFYIAEPCGPVCGRPGDTTWCEKGTKCHMIKDQCFRTCQPGSNPLSIECNWLHRLKIIVILYPIKCFNWYLYYRFMLSVSVSQWRNLWSLWRILYLQRGVLWMEMSIRWGYVLFVYLSIELMSMLQNIWLISKIYILPCKIVASLQKLGRHGRILL